MSQKSLGQNRVKAEFNPAKNDLVDQIKNKSAELIDLIESMKNFDENEATSMTHERFRLIEKAELDVETACMCAVKACFTD